MESGQTGASNRSHHLFAEIKGLDMARSTLDGPAAKKVKSLAAALTADDGELIQHRWAILCRTLRGNSSDYHGQIRKLLDDEQAARLARMTSFEL